MRQRAVPAEALLWKALRNRALGGLKISAATSDRRLRNRFCVRFLQTCDRSGWRDTPGQQAFRCKANDFSAERRITAQNLRLQGGGEGSRTGPREKDAITG